MPDTPLPDGDPATIAAAKTAQPLRISGWLATFDDGTSFESFSRDADVLTEVSPVWFNPGPNGEVLNRVPSGDAPSAREDDVRAICHAYGILLRGVPRTSRAWSTS